MSLRSAPAGGSVERTARETARAIERSGRTVGGNGLVFRRRSRLLGRYEPGFTLTAEELSLFLPSPDCPAPADGVKGGRIEELLPIGRTHAGTVVGPVVEPEQGRHVAVLGETGMGKSSLLVALARRAARMGGVVLFDPIGSTAGSFEEVLGEEELRRSIQISPTRSALEVNALDGIAPGEGNDRVRSERRLNDLVHSLRRVRSGRYADSSYWGPRLEEMLTRAVRAAAHLPRGTLVDAHTLLATGARLHRDVPLEAVGPIRELSERIRDRPEDAEGARRLLYEIVRSPVLERMLCAPTPDLTASELVGPRRIAILSGEAPRVGESVARYLLSVYLALVWSEVLSRPVSSKTFVILDEAQWFSHESLAEMLRLGRRANLHVVLATQSIASLPEAVKEAVWTNVSDFVAFRGSPEEAREFARAARGVSTDAILSLPRGHAAVLLGKGHTVRWLRTMRLPSTNRPASEGAPSSQRARTRTPAPIVSSVVPSELPPFTRTLGPPPSVGPTPQRPTPSGVIDLLRCRAENVPSGSLLRVSLEELRKAIDPEGSAVRAAGSALGRAGALIATERTDAGTVWCIAPARIPGGERFDSSGSQRTDS